MSYDVLIHADGSNGFTQYIGSRAMLTHSGFLCAENCANIKTRGAVIILCGLFPQHVNEV